MNKRQFIAAAAAVGFAGLCGGVAYSEPPASGLIPANVRWKDAPIPGVQTAVLTGDPAQPGIYVIRAKLGEGAKVMPHTHPDTRHDTVLSGEIYFGFGEVFDVNNAKLYPVGAQITVPANTPHFAWVKNGEGVLQEVGIGPSGHVAYKK